MKIVDLNTFTHTTEGHFGFCRRGSYFDGCNVLHAMYKWPKETFEKILKLEAECHSKLNHPNIVPFLGFDPETCELVTEGFDTNLEDFKKCFGIHKDDRKRILEAICSALKYLEDRNLAHLDIAPRNIFVNHSEGRITKVVLGDFGLCTEIGKKLLFDFPSESAPEIHNRLPVTRKSDIFLLGHLISFLYPQYVTMEKLAKFCKQEDPDSRPTLQEVISKLDPPKPASVKYPVREIVDLGAPDAASGYQDHRGCGLVLDTPNSNIYIPRNWILPPGGY